MRGVVSFWIMDWALISLVTLLVCWLMHWYRIPPGSRFLELCRQCLLLSQPFRGERSETLIQKPWRMGVIIILLATLQSLRNWSNRWFGLCFAAPQLHDCQGYSIRIPVSSSSWRGTSGHLLSFRNLPSFKITFEAFNSRISSNYKQMDRWGLVWCMSSSFFSRSWATIHVSCQHTSGALFSQVILLVALVTIVSSSLPPN